MHSHFRHLHLLCTALWLTWAPELHAADDLSERDFLGDLPTVLSVSRLAQPLNETPGAVTVIDRDMIRRSGARELTDLLRMVPGFVVGSFNGANPMANYHGDFDQLNRRLQVFIDGRSVYSTFFAGNVSHSMMGIVLDDVERIEVLRGSNSAAYGANAFSGVVNVVTRNATDVPTVAAYITQGEKGIADRSIRLAFGGPELGVRITASRAGDNGFDNVNDDKRVDQLHIRGDAKPTFTDDVSFMLGSISHDWGDHTAPGDTQHWHNAYLAANWVRRLGEEGEFRATGSFDEERFADQVLRGLPANGVARRYSVEIERSNRLSGAARVVFGTYLGHDEIRAPDIFATEVTQSADTKRLFGNFEWRPHPAWVVNAGALWEQHSISGAHGAPRLSVNYHLSRDHTLRVRTTQAQRLPTLFELRGDWRAPTFPAIPVFRASGTLRPERLVANEIGYLGEFRDIGLSVDFRAFEENGSSIARYFGTPTKDVVNKDPYRKRGWETQLRWQPRPETLVLVNHSVIRILSMADGITRLGDELAAPSHASALMWFESLPSDCEFSLAAYWSDRMTWGGIGDTLPPTRRVDLRFGRRFRVGATHVEAAIMAQSVTGSYPDYDRARAFPRRTFATLRLEF